MLEEIETSESMPHTALVFSALEMLKKVPTFQTVQIQGISSNPKLDRRTSLLTVFPSCDWTIDIWGRVYKWSVMIHY